MQYKCTSSLRCRIRVPVLQYVVPVPQYPYSSTSTVVGWPPRRCGKMAGQAFLWLLYFIFFGASALGSWRMRTGAQGVPAGGGQGRNVLLPGLDTSSLQPLPTRTSKILNLMRILAKMGFQAAFRAARCPSWRSVWIRQQRCMLKNGTHISR